jgi:hypothetical protein
MKGLNYIASAAAFIGAAILAYHGKDGWGLLIFAGCFLHLT